MKNRQENPNRALVGNNYNFERYFCPPEKKSYLSHFRAVGVCGGWGGGGEYGLLPGVFQVGKIRSESY